jgi:hypothetical protein
MKRQREEMRTRKTFGDIEQAGLNQSLLRKFLELSLSNRSDLRDNKKPIT